jgi:succinate-semialdehyde dehydrogenase/glutarate-semialdehyde dehydrogenase
MNLKDKSLFRQQCYINGEWVDANSGKTSPVTDPANGDVLGTVPNMGADETQTAIDAAHAALPAWKALTAKKRANILRKWFNLIMENVDDLGMIMTMEQGKPLAEAKGEIMYGASFIEWFAEEGKRIYGDVIPPHMADKRIIVLKEPIGVAAAITPWNFPSAMITRKAGPALAAGCTFICKSAHETPYSALALCELADRAGIPKGVLNIITGDAPAIGGVLTSSSIVQKLSFTGSTKIGKLLMKQCASTVKKVSMELGGNAPFMVFDDADVDLAVKGAMMCKFRNTGQTCVSANRIYVQAPIYDEFVEKLTAAVKTLKVGHGTEEGTTHGPLINLAALEKVEEHVKDAVSKGGRVTVGGKRHELGGTFYEATVVADATQEMLVAHEETFGPLAPIIKFETDEEAIAMANDTPFGLAAYFYANNMSRIFKIAEALESGMVGINNSILSTEVAPFGGVKESGIGREGSYMGIEEYVETKYLCISV